MDNKTAIQELMEIVEMDANNGVEISMRVFYKMLQDALPKERQQIEYAAFNGVKIGVMNCSYDKIENFIECDYSFAQKECSEYYNQTYTQKQQTT